MKRMHTLNRINFGELNSQGTAFLLDKNMPLKNGFFILAIIDSQNGSSYSSILYTIDKEGIDHQASTLIEVSPDQEGGCKITFDPAEPNVLSVAYNDIESGFPFDYGTIIEVYEVI